MKAEIVTIGDEILIGQIVNTNAAWLAKELTAVGFDVQRISTVSDKKKAIANAVNTALKKGNIVLLTGGLGPTKDDITKNTLSEIFDSPLVFNEKVFENVRQQFETRQLKMPEINREQAMIPDVCTPVYNKNGTAPGMWFNFGGGVLVSMPGVPSEMKAMFSDSILPRLLEKFSTTNFVQKTILTSGLGESALMERIAGWETNLAKEGVNLAYLPSPGRVRLRISLRGNNREELQNILEEKYLALQKIIPEYIYGLDEETVGEVVGKLLKQNGLSISTAESCTGGYLAHLLTAVPGSSDYFKGSIVSYANEVKLHQLGVHAETLERHGAVSREVVSQMAEGAKRVLQTDVALATSGIAGPTGGTAGKPVGTVWLAMAGLGQVKAKKIRLTTDRLTNIRSSAEIALQWLRKELLLGIKN